MYTQKILCVCIFTTQGMNNTHMNTPLFISLAHHTLYTVYILTYRNNRYVINVPAVANVNHVPAYIKCVFVVV